jgi:hypothetical protein
MISCAESNSGIRLNNRERSLKRAPGATIYCTSLTFPSLSVTFMSL